MPQLSYSQNAIAAQPGMPFDGELTNRDVVSRAAAAVNIPFGVYCELNSAGQAVPMQDANLVGTVTANNASPSITFTNAQTLAQGFGLQFGNQVGVTYYLASAITAATAATLTANFTGTSGAGQPVGTSPYNPKALGISLFDPLGSEQNYTTWGVTTTLTGTASVTNGSPNVSFSQSQTLAQGAQITFSNQPGVVYFLAQAVSGTLGTLTANYSGTTNGSVTASLPAGGSTAVGWRAGQMVPFMRKGRIWAAGDASGSAVQYGPIQVHHSSTGANPQGVFTFLGVNMTAGNEIDVAPSCVCFNPGSSYSAQYTDNFGNVFSVYPIDINLV